MEVVPAGQLADFQARHAQGDLLSVIHCDTLEEAERRADEVYDAYLQSQEI